MARHESYHHGDLRQALLRAGLELLAERGLDGVTLRETARRAGVSHAAPYHHFADKARLIEALTVESFHDFTAVLGQAWEATPGPSIARFRALGLAYVRFALDDSAKFRLMNRPELRRAGKATDSGPPSTEIEQAASESYEVLLRGVRSCQQEGFIASGEPEPYALAAWSTVHGLAVLLIDGLLKGDAVSSEEGMELAHTVTEVLGQGLIAR